MTWEISVRKLEIMMASSDETKVVEQPTVAKPGESRVDENVDQQSETTSLMLSSILQMPNSNPGKKY